jgi:tetratricopeptide (TPR) repeat protein
VQLSSEQSTFQRVSSNPPKRNSSIDILNSRANSEFASKNFTEAERDLKEAMHQDPRNPFQVATLAKVYEAEGRKQDAYELWKVLIWDTSKGFSSIHVDPVQLAHFGELAMALGHRKEATQAFTAASSHLQNFFTEPVEINPSDFQDIDSQPALAFYAAGTRQFVGGQNRESLANLSKCTSLKPTWALGHLAYGNVLFARGAKQQAIIEYARAKSLAAGRLRDFVQREQRSLGLNVGEVKVIRMLPNGVTQESYRNGADFDHEIRQENDRAIKNAMSKHRVEPPR